MREEFSGNRLGPTRMPWAHRRPGASRNQAGRIRYAHGGAPRVEPYCSVPQGGPQGGLPGGPQAGPQGPADQQQGVDTGAGHAGGDLGTGAWLAELPVGGRHADLWVLVCGGIAAAAAFAAAFVASGGVASHPATPGAVMPAVVSQACPAPSPAPAAGPTP
jgi:hypothetical protein